jgi:hypothetical protein
VTTTTQGTKWTASEFLAEMKFILDYQVKIQGLTYNEAVNFVVSDKDWREALIAMKPMLCEAEA